MKSWCKVTVGASWLALAVAASADPIPYASLGGAPTNQSGVSATTYGSEAAKLHDAVEAAKSGDVNRAMGLKLSLQDPLARRIVQWAVIDDAGTMVSFSDLNDANADLQGWPRLARRRAALEKALEDAAVPPSQTIAFFNGQEPSTPQGAMALAAAYQAADQGPAAQALIKKFWRDRVFELDQQIKMRQRFSQYLTADDDAARLEILLYGPQGPAARALLDQVSPDVRALGEARMALRADRSDAARYVDLVPAALQSDPGLAFDRARFYRKRDLDVLAVSFLKNFPQAVPDNADIVNFMWTERRALMNAALRSGDVPGAYAAVTGHGLAMGTEYAEAEFFAGWLALNRLHDPKLAEEHFVKLQAAVTSPISLARAFYWRGRAAEARGDAAGAAARYRDGAQYYTTFYGQLCLEKTGQHRLTLAPDPIPTADQKTAFQALDLVRAAQLLEEAGEHELYRVFVLAAAEGFSSAQSYAQLVDVARLNGDQDLSMRVVRIGAQKGFFLPERGYPIVQTPQDAGAAEPAFMLAIARQESNFDPNARSGPGARGLMQLMPSTAAIMARKLGVSYSPSMLQEGDYNLRLGGLYLGDLVSDFGGSYVMASAGYNAGPGRPTQWTSYCGDPRGGSRDPLDFIECIPFSETRNYVERTLETTQIYRARLQGGSAPLTLAEDLKRGAWTPGGAGGLPSNAPPGGPIPYSQMSPSASTR